MNRHVSRLRVPVAAAALALGLLAHPGVSMAALQTIPIPLTTYNVGTHTAGPITLPTGGTVADFTIDRTVGPFPLNNDPATTTVSIAVQISLDGGTTWFQPCSAGAIGGSYIDNETNTLETITEFTCPLHNETIPNRLARAVVVVGGAHVSFSGQLTIG